MISRPAPPTRNTTTPNLQNPKHNGKEITNFDLE